MLHVQIATTVSMTCSERSLHLNHSVRWFKTSSVLDTSFSHGFWTLSEIQHLTGEDHYGWPPPRSSCSFHCSFCLVAQFGAIHINHWEGLPMKSIRVREDPRPIKVWCRCNYWGEDPGSFSECLSSAQERKFLCVFWLICSKTGTCRGLISLNKHNPGAVSWKLRFIAPIWHNIKARWSQL